MPQALTSKDLIIQLCRQAFQLTPHCEPFRHVLVQTTHCHNRNQIDLQHPQSLLFLRYPKKTYPDNLKSSILFENIDIQS